MKRISYLLIFLIAASQHVLAQKLSKEEFRSKQEAFIIQKAKLTDKEAAQFFPLYFELQEKKSCCNKEAWEKIEKGKKEQLSEQEYARIVEDVVQARIATDKLDLEYVRKYKKFLPAKKIFDIQRAEMSFHRELLKPHRHLDKKNQSKK